MSAELLIRLPDYFPSLINAMQDGFVLRGTDGTIIEVNTAFCQMVGRDRSEIVGSRPPHAWWPEATRGQFDDVSQRYLSGVSAEDDLIYQRRNGTRFPAAVTNAPLRDSEGRIIAYIGTVKDMSERVKAERQIRFQAALIDQVQAAVIATDHTGTISFWNRGAEALYGWRHDEIVGRQGQDVLLGPGSKETVAAAVDTLNSGQPWEGEIEVPHRDGHSIPVLVSSSAIRDRDDRPTGIVGVVVDISERKRAESRVEAQYEVARSLSDAQTMRDGLRGTLSAIATHLDWQYGAFWIIDDSRDMVRCSETWHADGMDGERFEAICRAQPFARGAGLPGKVWESERSQWIRDYETKDHLARHDAFKTLQIRAAVALPVRIGGQIVGVIEFFATDVREPDHELLATAESIGSQVGQFIERKRAEGALRESEDRFRTMANSAPVLLWIAGTDGLGTWVNQGWLDYTGHTLEQEVGNGWTEGIHPADFDRCLDAYLSNFAARQTFDIEYRLRRHDGEYCWIFDRGIPRFDPDGAFAGFIGSCIEISDRKRHEEEQAFLSEATRELASSLDYHQTLTSVAQLAVPTIADWCVVHTVSEDGTYGQLAVAHVDPAKVAWAREIQERYPSDLTAPTGVPNVIRTGEPEIYPHLSDELLVAAARDEEHLELIREVGFTSAMIVPMLARGRVHGVITFVSAELGRHYNDNDLALAQNLAQRAAVAIDNALLYQEAQDAAKARDQFLAVAAHELRSPLTSMKGFAQLLLRRAKRLPGGSDWITPLQTIDAQVNRVTELVSRLLDVSRIEDQRLQLQVEPVDMVEVVRAAAVEAQLATEQHSVAARFAVEALVAPIDRTRIAQVLSNLLDNATKYSPAGTSIEIVLRIDGDDLVVAVIDEGPGIPPDAQARMFERYFRGTASTRATSEGLGLGLYVAHGIVEAHGGRMWVESEAGDGTTFSFSLPRIAPDADRRVQPSTEAVEA